MSIMVRRLETLTFIKSCQTDTDAQKSVMNVDSALLAFNNRILSLQLMKLKFLVNLLVKANL